MKININATVTSSNLVVVMEKKVLSYLMKQLDVHGKLAHTIETQPFEAKFEEVLHISLFPNFDNVWLVGADGPEKNYIKLGATITRVLVGRNLESVDVVIENEGAIQDVLSGMVLRDYSYDEYKSKKDECARARLNIAQLNIVTNASVDPSVVDELVYEAESVKLVRSLVNCPPCDLYPEVMARRLQDWLQPLGVKVEILEGEQIADMGLLCAVGKASVHKPRVVVMEWTGAGSDAVALVGKGVTYDSGGLSIKPSSSMESMKSDMAGAAVVAGVMANVARNKLKKRVIGIVGLVENMIAGNALRPDDVVISRAKISVEVNNTDAEGRLVLADILNYAQEKYKPNTIVDIATLTGAVVVALGHVFAGMFSNDDKLAQELQAAGVAAHEPLWRLPLHKVFDSALDSTIADMKNSASAGVGAGSATAAMFLKRFVDDDVAWAHLDVAGVEFQTGEDFASTRGATGFGVRALFRWLKQQA